MGEVIFFCCSEERLFIWRSIIEVKWNILYEWDWRKYACADSRLKWCDMSQSLVCWLALSHMFLLPIYKLHEFNLKLVLNLAYAMEHFYCYWGLFSASLTGGSSVKCKEFQRQQCVCHSRILVFAFETFPIK